MLSHCFNYFIGKDNTFYLINKVLLNFIFGLIRWRRLHPNNFAYTIEVINGIKLRFSIKVDIITGLKNKTFSVQIKPHFA